MSRTTFLSRFEEAMAHAGLSRRAIADHLGTAKSTITRWSHGAIPRAEIIDAIAKRCGVSTFWLSTGGGQMERSAPKPVEASPVIPQREPFAGINWHKAGPSPAPSLRIADFVSQEERLIIMRALSAAADRWRDHARTEAFQSEDVNWAGDAAIAETIYRQLAQ